jgi:hypothetical protein
MSTYRIYKNEKIINIIEADQAFINNLISKREIDSAIKVSEANDLSSLRFDFTSNCFVANPVYEESIRIQTKEQIGIDEMIKQLNETNEKIKILESQSKNELNDVQSAIYAIKGFMMLLPDIQKTLLQIQNMLQKKST